MDTFSDIERWIATKPGDKEMSIHMIRPGLWRVNVGNPSLHVMLGEVQGEFSAEVDSFDAVLVQLREWSERGWRGDGDVL